MRRQSVALADPCTGELNNRSVIALMEIKKYQTLVPKQFWCSESSIRRSESKSIPAAAPGKLYTMTGRAM